MLLVLAHTSGWSPAPLAAALAAAAVEMRHVASADALELDERPTVFLIDPEARSRAPSSLLAPLVDAGAAIVLLGARDERDTPEAYASDLLSAFVPYPHPPRQLLVALKAAFRESAARRQLIEARAETADRTSEVSELTAIGISLLTERNHRALLDLILTHARRMTQSDAGSLYLVEHLEDGGRHLRFTHAQNDSRPDIPLVEYVLPLDQTSVAGYAATTGQPVVLEDAYALPLGAPYRFNRTVDERHDYRTKSMLVVPMANHRGEVIGVLQLINRKRDPNLPFTDAGDVDDRAAGYDGHAVKLVRALAGQAAVSLENSQLYEAIERLFEGFVRAAVTAIEQRDPTTSGHSERVAGMTVALAQVVDRAADGPYAAVRFSPEQVRELQYAALLHDFGKVGVRERVLVKGKKLYGSDLQRIRERHAYLVRQAQWRFERARADYLEECGREGYVAFLRDHQARHAVERRELDRFLTLVLECNEPAVVRRGDAPALRELETLAARTYETLDGTPAQLLSPAEFRCLSIAQGTLDEVERREIESHVAHTFTFLRRIPWTAELHHIPDIAYGHHEKLDGTGYPRGVKGAAIPVQTRMMTIADIYDALTAADRPYKRAVPSAAALDILAAEVRQGQLDAELFRLFVDGRVFERHAS